MDIVDIYLETGNFQTAVRQSGLPVHIAHMKLLKSGVLKIQDKIQYGSRAAKLGGLAEELFQKYVPNAVDANKYFEKNNPVYDFMFGNLTIDVKYSSLHKGRGNGGDYWGIRVTGDQDFICAFLESEKNKELDNPKILLIPMAFITTSSKQHISQNSYLIKEFSIEPEELQPLLKQYSELRDEGMF